MIHLLRTERTKVKTIPCCWFSRLRQEPEFFYEYAGFPLSLNTNAFTSQYYLECTEKIKKSFVGASLVSKLCRGGLIQIC